MLTFQFGNQGFIFRFSLLVPLFNGGFRVRVCLGDGIFLRLNHQGLDQKAKNGQCGNQDCQENDYRNRLAFLLSTHYYTAFLINSEFRIQNSE